MWPSAQQAKKIAPNRRPKHACAVPHDDTYMNMSTLPTTNDIMRDKANEPESTFSKLVDRLAFDKVDSFSVHHLGSKRCSKCIADVLNRNSLLDSVTCHFHKLLGQMFVEQWQQLLVQWVGGLEINQRHAESILGLVNSVRNTFAEVWECSWVVLELSEHELFATNQALEEVVRNHCGRYDAYLGFQLSKLAQLLENIRHDFVLDSHELCLIQQHGRADFVRGSDHTALVGGGILHDAHASLLKELDSSISCQEEIRTL